MQIGLILYIIGNRKDIRKEQKGGMHTAIAKGTLYFRLRTSFHSFFLRIIINFYFERK